VPLVVPLAAIVSHAELVLKIERALVRPRPALAIVLAVELHVRALVVRRSTSIPVVRSGVVPVITIGAVDAEAAILTPTTTVNRVPRATPAEGRTAVHFAAAIVVPALLRLPHIASADQLRPVRAVARVGSTRAVAVAVA
jgi:hypothetical protein